MKTTIKSGWTIIALIALVSSVLLGQVPDQAKVIAGAERAFEKVAKAATGPSPGCAVGVSLNGQSVFEKAIGLAEMEHNVPNTPQTIFESGSVAKQFTATAVVLLSLDGKLSLDDPVRKHIPELPEYGSPLTIRHLMNHTAGLRDWGTVMALTGVGRGDRVVNQDLAIDLIVNQKGLDFVPGAEYSYSNSGYQLLAEIVERVSKQKFPAFTAERLFKPLGMIHSSWRDDYQRLVPGRAQAYGGPTGGPYRLVMPFMNVYGNGGMLTTVGDWLKWNAMLESRSMGAPLVEALETVGVLNDNRKITYALGLTVDKFNGIREVSHSGATAGYQTFLARYPDQKLSVAVLCNGPNPNAVSLGQSIAGEILGPFPVPPQPEPYVVKPVELNKFTGLWRNERTRSSAMITLENDALRFSGSPLRAQPDGSFLLGNSRITFKLDKDGKPISGESNQNGDVFRITAVSPWDPTAGDLAALAGDWRSDEAGALFKLVIEGGKPFLTQRPSTKLPLRPTYKDTFTAPGGQVVWFTRDAKGKIDKMHIGASRMRDMPFLRVGGPAVNK